MNMINMPEMSQNLQVTFLNWILGCDSEAKYNRSLGRVGDLYSDECERLGVWRNRDVAFNIHHLDRWLKRRAVRRYDYVPYAGRERRVGLPFTYAEDRILDWAFKPPLAAESLIPPTCEYIADLLCRSVDEIEGQAVERRKDPYCRTPLI